MPGTFKRAIDKAEEIKILLNHSWNHVLGSTKTNLKLTEDVIGLRAHAEIDDPEVVKKAKEKRLRGWSFRFFAPAQTRAGEENGIPIREISDMQMDEVSLIDDRMRPWYPSTTVEVRAGEETETEFEIRAEESEFDYIGFEKEKPKKYDNSKLKELIESYGGKV